MFTKFITDDISSNQIIQQPEMMVSSRKQQKKTIAFLCIALKVVSR